MFDYTDNSASFHNSVKINAVSGTLVKNYKDSFFLRFGLMSELATELLSKEPKMVKSRKTKYFDNGHYMDSRTETEICPVVVLQTMLCGDGYVLCEIMWKDDFDKMFEKEGEQG